LVFPAVDLAGLRRRGADRLAVDLAVDFLLGGSAAGDSAVVDAVDVVDPPERPRPRPLPPRRRRRGFGRGSSDPSPADWAGESRASSVIPRSFRL
jgi:hypothetical protein